MTAALVVVDPASIPRKTAPSAFARSPRFIVSFAWRDLNSSSSVSFSNSGLRYFVSEISSGEAFSSFDIRVSSSTGSSLSARYAAPMATKNFALSGNTTSSSLRPSVSMNLFLSSESYSRGPPRKATLPFIGCPHASPDII